MALRLLRRFHGGTLEANRPRLQEPSTIRRCSGGSGLALSRSSTSARRVLAAARGVVEPARRHGPAAGPVPAES
jgi:hypothetical protein